MSSMNTAPVTNVTLALLGLFGAPLASAQGLPLIPPPGGPIPDPTRGFAGLLIILALTVAAVGIAGMVLYLWQAYRRGRTEAALLEEQMNAALQRAGRHGISVLVRHRVGMAPPLVVEVVGDVTHPELRDTVVKVIRQEAAPYGPDVDIHERVAMLHHRSSRSRAA